MQQTFYFIFCSWTESVISQLFTPTVNDLVWFLYEMVYQPSWVIWFRMVLWHINHCRLFNAESDLFKYKVKLGTVIEGNPKAPFSLATTPRCRGEGYSLSRINPLFLDSRPIMLSVKYHFWVFGTSLLGIDTKPPGPSVNNLPTSPMGW